MRAERIGGTIHKVPGHANRPAVDRDLIGCDDMTANAVGFAVTFGLMAMVVAVLLSFPEVSESIRQRAAVLLCGLRGTLQRLQGVMAHRLRRLAVRDPKRAVFNRRRMPFAALAVLLVLPPVLTLSWKGVEGDASFGRSPTYQTHAEGTVAALLRGEHLTPPAALPPAMFATREVELVRPRLAYASRAWELLDDAFAQRLLRAYQLMKERHGYDMVLIEGYRSPERQNELAAMGSHVTSAAAFQSYHQYGLAADSAFLKDGKLVISEKDAWAMQGYRLFGGLAVELGLTWGGDWTLRDFGHVEWRRGKALR